MATCSSDPWSGSRCRLWWQLVVGAMHRGVAQLFLPTGHQWASVTDIYRLVLNEIGLV